MADISIKYKNTTIAELNESGTKTLNTKGTYCEDNIIIQYDKTGQTPTSNFKRWDITITSGVPASGYSLNLILNDEWLKENRSNPNLCILITPQSTIQGSGHIQGLYFGTNKALMAQDDGVNCYSLSAYKHSNGATVARMRGYGLTSPNDIGDIGITSAGTLYALAMDGYPLAVGDYVVIAFIA